MFISLGVKLKFKTRLTTLLLFMVTKVKHLYDIRFTILHINKIIDVIGND